jgi:hypothetical protein
LAGLRGVREEFGFEDIARSVSSFNAVEGARTWYLGSEIYVFSGLNERSELVRVDVALGCAGR